MSGQPVSETELQVYVDGHLPAARAAEVARTSRSTTKTRNA